MQPHAEPDCTVGSEPAAATVTVIAVTAITGLYRVPCMCTVIAIAVFVFAILEATLHTALACLQCTVITVATCPYVPPTLGTWTWARAFAGAPAGARGAWSSPTLRSNGGCYYSIHELQEQRAGCFCVVHHGRRVSMALPARWSFVAWRAFFCEAAYIRLITSQLQDCCHSHTGAGPSSVLSGPHDINRREDGKKTKQEGDCQVA